MRWHFREDRPIYAQIVEQIQRGILSGEYPPGSGMPSVRTLALEAEVNPNTMQKALAELEAQGLLLTHRTAGRTVTLDSGVIGKMKERLASAHISAFLGGMDALGIDGGEAVRMVQEAMR